MTNLLFDYAKGRWAEKYLLPTGTDNIVVVLLQSTGLQADATLRTYPTLGAVTSAGNVEATFTNYGRHVVSGTDITVSVNTSTHVVTVDISDQIWNAAGGAVNNTLGALLTCYRPTSSTPDSGMLPLTKHDCAIPVAGGNLTITVPSIGTTT